MKKYLYTAIFTAAFFLFILSCADNVDGDDCTTVYTPLKKVEATFQVDLEERADWQMVVGNHIYNHQIENSKIVATPSSNEETYSYVEYFGVNCYVEDRYNIAYSYFTSPEWYTAAKTKGEYNDVILDQSTSKALFQTDVLVADIAYKNSEQIAIDLKHMYDKLIFRFIDMPENSTVKLVWAYWVVNKKEITPYSNKNKEEEEGEKEEGEEKEEDVSTIAEEEEEFYQALVSAASNFVIEVTIEDKIYNVSLTNLIGEAKGSYDFNFDIKYNKDEEDKDKKLTIENLEKELRDK